MKNPGRYLPAVTGLICALGGQAEAHVAYTDITASGSGEASGFKRYGWLAGTDAILGDSHVLAGGVFFKFHLDQASLVTITFSQISGAKGSVVTTGVLDPAFSLYAGLLPDQAHDDAIYDATDSSTVDLAPAGHVYKPHDGYRDTVNRSATGGLFYRGQFDALGDWSMANEDAIADEPTTIPGNWAKITYITHVNEHVTALGADAMPSGTVDNTPEVLKDYYLVPGDYTIAASGASCNNLSKVTCTGGGQLWGRVTMNAVPAPKNNPPVFLGTAPTLTVPNAGVVLDLKPYLRVADTDSAQTETWTATTAPNQGGTLVATGSASSGSADITPNGTFTYKPKAGFVGTETFTISVSDGVATVPRTFTFNVTANTVPSFLGGPTVNLSLSPNRSTLDLKPYLLVSDTDFGQTETWTRRTAPGAGSVLTVSGARAASGSTSITPAGTLSYKPATGNTTADFFQINVSDGAATVTRTFNVTFRPNVPPTFLSAATNLTVAQNSPALDIKANLRISDTDVGQTDTWTQASAPNNGGVLTLSNSRATSGSTAITAGGILTYQPKAGFVGTETFAVQVSDTLATATRAFTVTVAPNIPPTFLAAATNLTVAQNSPALDLKANVRVSDTNFGQTETWAVASAPDNGGTLTLNNTRAASGSTSITSAGVLTYQPKAGFAGTEKFTISVSDGVNTALRNFVVTVAANIPPTFTTAATTLAVAQDSPALDLKANVRVSDTNFGQTETWTVSSAPDNGGTLTLVNTRAASGTTAITSGGTFTYQPKAGFAGTEKFTIRVSDGTAAALRAFTVNVGPNIAPTFVGGTTTPTVAKNSLPVDLKANVRVSDTNFGQIETWTVASAPDNGGTLNLVNTKAGSGSTAITSGGTFTYQPKADFVGTEKFTIQVNDGYTSAFRSFVVTVR